MAYWTKTAFLYDLYILLVNLNSIINISGYIKEKFYLNLTIITDTLYEYQYTFMILSRSIILRLRNVADKYYITNQNILLCSVFYFFENRAVYEIMWKNIVEPDGPQITTWRVRIAFWITELTNIRSEYINRLLTTSPLQHWLHESA
jgi:hypothetical protein